MSTLKKNKRIKLARQLEIYGDLKPTTGNTITRRGKAKYLGGNGRKTTGISRRLFKKNLQSVRVMEDGQVVRRRVPVSMLRSGLVLKPVIREPFTIDEPIRAEQSKTAARKAARKAVEAKKAEPKKAEGKKTEAKKK
jgi:large subunit ribosomal protein L28